MNNNISIVIDKCLHNPTIEYFEQLLNLVTPDMMRGAVNVDNYGRAEHIFNDFCNIAMVIAGYKPLCVINKNNYCKWMKKYNIRVIYSAKYFIIWIQDNQTQNAIKFGQYLKNNKLCSIKNNKEHHYIVGKYLGIPIADTDYYIQHLIKMHQDAINRLL